MLPQDYRNMSPGFSTILTDKVKGIVRVYIPYPTELPHLKEICALDPST